jgi:hypothetical protein
VNDIPDEFREALLLLMPDADIGPSSGETAYFPCYDPQALDFGNRLFRLEPNTMPRLDYELEVRIPAGTMRARGTWHGADPPGGVAVPEPRLWIADSRAFEVVREVRRPFGAAAE